MTRFRRKTDRGTSLLEVIIATGILLGVGLYVIMLIRGGGMKQESFSSEHFTAMFLAQKVIEDINDQVAVNPYYFNELISYASGGSPQSVVDGKSPFFRLLENTAGFASLVPGEDLPITKESDLYDQLKMFSCKVDSGLVPDPDNPGNSLPNLVRITVAISWKDRVGMAHQYSIEQNIYGYNHERLKIPPNFEPIEKDLIVQGLYKWLDPEYKSDDWSIDKFILYNKGGDSESIMALGTMLTGLLMCDTSVKEFNASISRAEGDLGKFLKQKVKASKIVALKEHIAQLKEQKACTLFYIFSRIEPAIRKLENSPLDETVLGPKLFEKRKGLAGTPILLLNHTLKISIGFASSESIYREILAPPQRGVSPNRQIQLIQHMIDLKKIGLLLSFESGTKPDQRMGEFRKSLSRMIGRYKGKQPQFVKYLEREMQIAQNADNLKKAMGGLYKQLSLVQNLSKPLTKIYEKVSPKKKK